MTPPNAIHKRAAAMVWADFRDYIIATGRDYDEVYATIAHGEMGMGDWCDDNMFVADVLVELGLIADECPDPDNAQEVHDWNRVQGCIYAHTGVTLVIGPTFFDDNETLVYYAGEHSPAVLSIRLAALRTEEPGVIDEVLPHIQRGEVCFVGGGASPLIAVWMDTTGDGNDITTAARAFAIARGEVSR